MGILDSIVEWIATQVMNLLDLITGSVLGALGCDMSTFLRYFPAAETLYEIFVAIGVGFILLNLVWQLFRNFGLGLGLSAEDPVKLAIKSILFIFLALFADQIMVLVLGIVGTPYDWVVDTALPPIEFASFASVVTVLVGSLVSGSVSLIVLILVLIVAWNYIKLLFEAAERYILVGVLIYTAPVAFATGASENTSNVFSAWCRMLGGQLFLLIMNEKCGRLHLKVKNPELRIDRLKDIPEGVIAIEVDQAVAKKLFGQTIAIRCYDNTVEHTVGEVNGSYWFKVDIGSQEGESNYEEEP